MTKFGAQLFELVDYCHGNLSGDWKKRIEAPLVGGASLLVSLGCRWAGTR